MSKKGERTEGINSCRRQVGVKSKIQVEICFGKKVTSWKINMKEELIISE